jgi:sirohydrochlorin cobaltochelatase
MIAPEPDRSASTLLGPQSGGSHAFWERFGREFGSILVVGHGTRNPSGALQLLDLVAQMQIKAPAAKIFGCFLELAEPSIEQAIERLSEQGIKKTLVVPVLLFTAGHALQDIPEAVAQAGKRFGIEVIGQTGSLGTHPSVLELSQVRYAEIIALDKGQACPASACARVQCNTGRCEGQSMTLGRIGLAMVGRGTSDQQALAHMRQLTELKVAQLSVVRYQTGFFAGGQPNVDGLLEEVSQWECESVLVQPHLLFEGELIEQLRDKVLQCQLRYPNKQWLIARTLGADPKLADVFLDLAREELEGWKKKA